MMYVYVMYVYAAFSDKSAIKNLSKIGFLHECILCRDRFMQIIMN